MKKKKFSQYTQNCPLPFNLESFEMRMFNNCMVLNRSQTYIIIAETCIELAFHHISIYILTFINDQSSIRPLILDRTGMFLKSEFVFIVYRMIIILRCNLFSILIVCIKSFLIKLNTYTSFCFGLIVVSVLYV